MYIFSFYFNYATQVLTDSGVFYGWSVYVCVSILHFSLNSAALSANKRSTFSFY